MAAILPVIEIQLLTNGEAEKLMDSKPPIYVDSFYYTDLATAKLMASAKEGDPSVKTVRAEKHEICLN